MNDADTVSLDGARARLEAGDVTEVSWMTWDVAGDPERGDSLGFYLVWFNSDLAAYQCACQESMIEKRLCEHIVAVILYRGKQGDSRVGGEWNPDHVPDHNHADAQAIVLSNATPSDQFPMVAPTSTEWGIPPFPVWVREFRPHQWDAAVAIVEAFRQGSRVVFLDAPTGSGKTLIAELVRRMMNERALYICSDKQLQDQFAKDFDYSKVLKGRANYPTLNEAANGQGITAGDCDKHVAEGDVRVCSYCLTRTHECPYEVAKRDALRADLAVLNSTYFLTEANNVGKFAEERDKDGNMGRRRFVIVDECDVLENELMRFVEFYVGENNLRRLSLDAPKKGSHHTTIANWLGNEYVSACQSEASRIPKDAADIRLRRRRMALLRMIDEALMTSAELMSASEEEGVLWVRDNDAGPLSLKPVRVDRQAPRFLWDHADRWLCMSATVISGDVEAQSLGLNQAEIPWTVVKVPMTFDVINRPIYVAPCADMSWDGRKAGGWDHATQAIKGILARHPNERVLIHAVSYALAKHLTATLRKETRRSILTYENAGQRTNTLLKFSQEDAGVLIAPSMERGVDLKDDLCRVIIVAKVPYPYVGDKAVAARMRQGRDGNVWYAVQAIRALVQMTGRAVRSQDDWAYTYIIDSQFLTNLNSKWGHLLPSWWKEAMQVINARALLKEGEG